jgi:hypothetical protein
MEPCKWLSSLRATQVPHRGGYKDLALLLIKRTQLFEVFVPAETMSYWVFFLSVGPSITAVTAVVGTFDNTRSITCGRDFFAALANDTITALDL